MYGGEARCIEVWWGMLRYGDHCVDLGVAGRIILKWIFKMRCGGKDWIDVLSL
jgi:hypothetical protein